MDIEPNGTLYIPHDRNYCPNKRDKKRVVYDCSSEFRRRRVNKELLSGPDLTNQIVSVLSRFREHCIHGRNRIYVLPTNGL